ncbi:Dicarboxylic amino acid permease [Vanrija pseudolonga]|uniref:Dicarboxylic amino acid permease n=1 Tax=Vanrija pseudolonga TaxID=143232 RepID=A0AAF1BEM2_9TREE|nr:Dicarboxylic amino acid permease [Vanrija pseudolonga]
MTPEGQITIITVYHLTIAHTRPTAAWAGNWPACNPPRLSAIAVLMNYWVKDTVVNNAVRIIIALVFVFAINMFPAAVYGETEFIFSSIKVITIVGLIIAGIAINCGAGPKGHYIGFSYWKNPGAFGVNYNGLKGSKGKFLGFWAVLTQAAFSYFGGEVVAVAAAESKNPVKSIPRAIKQVYLRICVFYILGTFIIGLNCPSNEPRLGTTSDATASPFVIAISRAGIKVLPHIINGCLISSAWSAANADIYIASRSIYTLASQGWLPKVFLTTSKRGAPYVASITAGLSGLLAFMTVSNNANKVFNWFVNLITVGGLMVYTIIAITYLRFRKGVEAQGIDRSQMPFTSGFAKTGAWIAACFIPLIIFFSGWEVFLHNGKKFDHATFITNYLPVVLVLGAYGGHKLYAKTKPVPISEMDLHTGARHKGDYTETTSTEKLPIWERIGNLIGG